MTPPVLSVVVPTRNEAPNLPELVRRILTALGDTPCEVCIVDDSDDDTPAVIERLAAEHPDRVRPHFRHGAERAGGLSTAVVAGLRMAAGRFVCVMDADLQHPPETLPSMLAAAAGGADLVVASRNVPGGGHGGLDGRTRRLVSAAATRLARAVFWEARRSTDPLSGFFLCRRSLIDGIEFRPVGFKILLELLVLLPAEVRVRDVPLDFRPRAQGVSKASVGQGIAYLRHVRSLFLDVRGSARGWKFTLVGLSGLVVFLPLLALLDGAAHLAPLVAFLPAFAVSLAWNTALNRVWTFADRRRRQSGEGPGRYLRFALMSGLLMFAVFAVLVGAGWRPVAAGTVAAVVAAAGNAAANWRAVRAAPAPWGRLAADRDVQAALEHLATTVGGDRAYVLPAADAAAGSTIPAALVERTTAIRRPVLWTEAASHRPQRRSNIEMVSALLVPVVAAGEVLAIVVCERRSPRGFDSGALETATRLVEPLGALLEADLSAGGDLGAASDAEPAAAARPAPSPPRPS